MLPDGFMDLMSPTSMHMKHTYVLKTMKRPPNERLAAYKRKSEYMQSIGSSTVNDQANPYFKQLAGFKPVAKISRPAPRDGHSAILVADRFMLMFGGDRNQMPFNDLLLLDLGKELQDYALFLQE